MKANGLVLEKTDTGWIETYVELKGITDILSVLGTDMKGITQVNIDRYRKIFYSNKNLEKYGSISAMIDVNEERWYMVAPLLLVECNDIEPIILSKKVENEIKDKITLY